MCVTLTNKPPLTCVSVHRAWYELSQYGFVAALANTEGLTWSAFSDDNNHMGFLLVAFVIEWFLFAVIAWYLEQVGNYHYQNEILYLICAVMYFGIMGNSFLENLSNHRPVI